MSTLKSPTGLFYVRFAAFMAVTMKNVVFWDVTPFSSCKNKRFGGAYRLHYQGDIQRTRNNVSNLGDALLDVYLIRPESLVKSCAFEQGVQEHFGVLLEVDWEENYISPKVERLGAVYIKTNILGLRTFL
jgi:hypothetical protein